MASRRPNILLITTDQEQHWDLLPPGLSRPGIESLLETGVAFGAHHVVALPCGPSRSTIYTGRHIWDTKVWWNPGGERAPGLVPSVPTWGAGLRDLGYHTAYKGKWHVSWIPRPEPFRSNAVNALEDYGFSEYTADGDPVGVAWDGYRHDPAISSDAANWLLSRSGAKPDDRPWCLAVNFVNPHDIMFFDATGQMNRDGSMPSPRMPAPLDPLYEKEWDVELPSTFAEVTATRPQVQATSQRRLDAMVGAVDHGDEVAWRSLRSYYFNCLRDVDRHVSTVLRALKKSGHEDDTVVLYTSDHGELAGAHGMREKPTSVFREVVNVPLIVRHPDCSPGARAQLTSAIDIAPTILAMAGARGTPLSERLSPGGHDFSPLMSSASGPKPRDVAGVLFAMASPPPAVGADALAGTNGRLRHALDAPALPAEIVMCGMRRGRWKIAVYASDAPPSGGGASVATEIEVYDTVEDPRETTNVARDPEQVGVVAELVGGLRDLIRSER